MEVAVSITGLLAAVFKISNTLQQFISAVDNAPSLSRTICFEIHDFRFVLLKLEPIIRGSTPLNLSRACLVDTDHLSVTLTGCVLALSELETEVKKLKLSGKLDIWDRMKWSWAEPELMLITQRLQNQKLSLVLILTILTSESSTEAAASQQTHYENFKLPSYSNAIGATPIDDKTASLTFNVENTTRAGSPVPSVSCLSRQAEPPSFQGALLFPWPHRRAPKNPDSSLASPQHTKRRWSMLIGVSRGCVTSSQTPAHTTPGVRHGKVLDYDPTPIPIPTEMLASPHMHRFKTTESSKNELDGVPPVEPVLGAANDLKHKYALHFAAEEGLINDVRWLLAHERNVDEENDDFETPLKLAVQSGHMQIVRLLLAYGAKTAVIFSNGTTILHLAAELGNKVIVQMLLDSGAELEARTVLGDTPLQFAVIMGRAAVVRLMLDRGVDKNTRENGGATPLHRAACVGQKEIVRLLLDKGVRTDVVDADGNTPLHFAELGGYQEAVDLLLYHGADPRLRNKNNRTSNAYLIGGQLLGWQRIKKAQSVGTIGVYKS